MKYKHIEMVKEVRRWIQLGISLKTIKDLQTIKDVLKPRKENTYDESKVVDYDWYMKNR